MILNAFTVDLEEWYQGLTSTNPQVSRWPELESRVVPATKKLLGILNDYKVEATFFVLGYVADRHPALIEEIAAAGHEIGVHGYYHRFVYRMTPAEFGEELARGIDAVVQITGERPLGHRAPYFSVNAKTPWAFEQLDAAGFTYDSSVFPTRNMLYGFPGAPQFPYRVEGRRLWEFPASTIRLGKLVVPVAGGFYVRAFPYWLTRRALQHLNRNGHAAIMYVHPWELDLGQHYRQVTRREQITHYYGRRGLETKLRRLLQDFSFTSIRRLIEPQAYPQNSGDEMVQTQIRSGATETVEGARWLVQEKQGSV